MNLLRRAAVLAMTASCVAAAAQSIGQPRETLEPPKPPVPESTAQLIGVTAEIDQLKSLSGNLATADRWQLLWLHQRIYEQVMAASLQVDATIAQIDNEIARANEVRGFLADRRDRTVSRDNLLSAIFGGAIGATSDGLELSSKLDRTGTAVGVGAGAVGAGLALAGIHAQPGKTSHFVFPSNMLAEFFDRPTLPNSRYPATVWTFLNEIPSFGPPGVTRREELMQSWVQVRRINSFEDTQKIDHVTSQPSEPVKLSIDDFEDRAAMLQDVRARISYLKRDLGELLASLPPVTNGP
jgi:hypothetical protein